MPDRSRLVVAASALVLCAGLAGDVMEQGALAHAAALVATIGALVALIVLLPRLLAGQTQDPIPGGSRSPRERV